MILLYIVIAILAIFKIWDLSTRKFIDEYQLFYYFGKKGCGKSTIITKKAIKYLKKGFVVYTNNNDISINGVRIISDPREVGKFKLPERSVFLFDEVELFFDSRSYAKTPEYFISQLRGQRHDKLIFYFFSQTFVSSDKRIRQLADHIYLTKKWFRVVSVSRRVVKTPDIRDNTEGESQFVDRLVYAPIFAPNAIEFTFIPFWIKYFNSFKPLQDNRLMMPFKTVSGGFDYDSIFFKDKIKSFFKRKKKPHNEDSHISPLDIDLF